MAETLPEVNEEIKESIKDNRERLQKSMRAGLLNVRKSVDSLHSTFKLVYGIQDEMLEQQKIDSAFARETLMEAMLKGRGVEGGIGGMSLSAEEKRGLLATLSDLGILDAAGLAVAGGAVKNVLGGKDGKGKAKDAKKGGKFKGKGKGIALLVTSIGAMIYSFFNDGSISGDETDEMLNYFSGNTKKATSAATTGGLEQITTGAETKGSTTQPKSQKKPEKIQKVEKVEKTTKLEKVEKIDKTTKGTSSNASSWAWLDAARALFKKGAKRSPLLGGMFLSQDEAVKYREGLAELLKGTEYEDWPYRKDLTLQQMQEMEAYIEKRKKGIDDSMLTGTMKGFDPKDVPDWRKPKKIEKKIEPFVKDTNIKVEAVEPVVNNKLSKEEELEVLNLIKSRGGVKDLNMAQVRKTEEYLKFFKGYGGKRVGSASFDDQKAKLLADKWYRKQVMEGKITNAPMYNQDEKDFLKKSNLMLHEQEKKLDEYNKNRTGEMLNKGSVMVDDGKNQSGANVNIGGSDNSTINNNVVNNTNNLLPLNVNNNKSPIEYQ